MKNGEMLQLINGFANCMELKGVKLLFAIAKNSKILKKEIDLLQELIKGLQEKHAERDEKGELIIEDDKYVMKDEKQFVSEYNELMNIEVDVKLHKIKQEDLPNDISAVQMVSLIDIIED